MAAMPRRRGNGNGLALTCIPRGHPPIHQDLVGAPSLEEVAEKVAKLAEGRIIVGHSLSKDLKVLLLSHPRKDIRDTAK